MKYNIPKFYKKGDIVPSEQKTIIEKLDDAREKKSVKSSDYFFGSIFFIGYLVVAFAIIRFIFNLIF